MTDNHARTHDSIEAAFAFVRTAGEQFEANADHFKALADDHVKGTPAHTFAMAQSSRQVQLMHRAAAILGLLPDDMKANPDPDFVLTPPPGMRVVSVERIGGQTCITMEQGEPIAKRDPGAAGAAMAGHGMMGDQVEGQTREHGANWTAADFNDRPRATTSADLMRAGGVDPDAPFEVGQFPAGMRQAPLPDPDPEALAWLQQWVRDDMKRLGETQTRPTHDLTEEGDEFTRSVVLEAYVAGRAQSWLLPRIGKAVELLTEGADLLRGYEQLHRSKVKGWQEIVAANVSPESVSVADTAIIDTLHKAEVNADMAQRFETWLRNGDLLTIRQGVAAFAAANPGAVAIDADAYAIDISGDAALLRTTEETRDVFGFRVESDESEASRRVPIIEQEALTWSVDDPTAQTIGAWLRGPAAALIITASIQSRIDRIGLDIPTMNEATVGVLLAHVANAISPRSK